MTANGIFMTGFPGFIGGRLVGRLLDRGETAGRFHFLVLPDFMERAQASCRALETRHPDFAGRWVLHAGDITRLRLGLDAAALAVLRDEVARVWHLAAFYHLAAPLAPSFKINVEGTQNVLDFCLALPGLERLLYISTCYVAGDRKGHILEKELDVGQGFKNHYESTKFLAEIHVRRRMGAIPTTIFRPSIVVGDSRTGETIKADGPYYIILLLLRLPRLLPFVHLGPGGFPVNIVPVDFLVDAMAAIAADPRSAGRTCQLADPEPPTVREVTDGFLRLLGRPPALGTLPDALARALTRRKLFGRLLRVPSEAFAYFFHPVSFDIANTVELLAGTGVHCPVLESYMPVMVDYARKHLAVPWGSEP